MLDYGVYQILMCVLLFFPRKLGRKLPALCNQIQKQNRVCLLCRITRMYCGEADFRKLAASVQHIILAHFSY